MTVELDPDKQSRYVPDEYEGKLEPNYYCRNWIAKREKYCENRAGMRTGHLGFGRCWKHAGRPIEHGRTSKWKEEYRKQNMTAIEKYRDLPPKIQDLFDEFQADPEILTVENEIALAKAVLIDYIKRYDEARKKLDEWYDWYLSEVSQNPPRVKLLPVENVITFLKKITDIAHKERKLRTQDAISISDFYQIMGKMGKVVERWVMEPGMEDEEKLKRIRDDWMKIDIER